MRPRSLRCLGAVAALSALIGLAACEKKTVTVIPNPGAGAGKAPAPETPPGEPAALEPDAPTPSPRSGTPDVPGAEPAPGTTAPPEPASAKPAPAPARGAKVVLPAAVPLTQDAARRILLDAIETSPDPDVTRAALLALAESSGADAVRAASAKHLARGAAAGGYADPDAAASALEALVRAGDADAAQRAMALARAGIDDEDVYDSFATMLAAIQGPAAGEARKLLLLLADDIDVRGAAVRALVPFREKDAAKRFHDLATDAADTETDVRASAAAGLLALGDPRADAVLAGLVHETGLEGEDAVNSYDVIDGLAIAGAPEALPWIRKLADPVIAEDVNADLEIRSLVGAYVDVRGAGGGTKEDLESLARLLGKAHGTADDEIRAALWSLGDDTRAEAAANVLAACVRDISSQVVDEEEGVRLLDAVAARRAAGSDAFRRIIDAAAAVEVPKDTKRADAAGRAMRLRVAAARAFLASTKR